MVCFQKSPSPLNCGTEMGCARASLLTDQTAFSQDVGYPALCIFQHCTWKKILYISDKQFEVPSFHFNGIQVE